MNYKYLVWGAFLTLGLLIGGFSGYFYFRGIVPESCVSDLRLIKPNLDCGISDQKSKSLAILQKKLELLVAGYVSTGKAKRIGIFVRDLRSSRFAGVNDNDVFYMASLLKLPLLIGGYKLAEVEPRILDQEIVYTGSPNLYNEQIIKPKEQLTIGASYTVKELMRRAVVYSDNTTAQLLFDYYPKEFLDRILQALGLQIKRPEGESENLITARIYTNVFRMLYNSSYLTKEYSNDALSLLTQTSYNNGVVAKLPLSSVVAHKFAERTFVDPSNQKTLLNQLHECAIVYAENALNPYTFCVMTEGNDYKNLEEILQDVSLDIYNLMVDG